MFGRIVKNYLLDSPSGKLLREMKESAAQSRFVKKRIGSAQSGMCTACATYRRS